MEYEEYTVKPVDRLTIRQSDTEEGISYGTGQNNYIIQGNMFTLGLEENVLRQIAENIYDNVAGVEYRPFRAQNKQYTILKYVFSVDDPEGSVYLTYRLDHVDCF